MHARSIAPLVASLLVAAPPLRARADATVPPAGSPAKAPAASATALELRGQELRLTHGHGGPPAHLSGATFVVRNATDKQHRLALVDVVLHRAFGVGGEWQKPLHLRPLAMARDLADSAAATGRTPLTVEPRTEEVVRALFTGIDVDSHARYRLVLVLSVDGVRREVEVPLTVWSRMPLRDDR